LIENAFLIGESELLLGHSYFGKRGGYTIMFSRMIQKHIGGRSRKIRRRDGEITHVLPAIDSASSSYSDITPSPLANTELSLPSHWEPHSESQNLRVVNITRDSLEWKEVVSLMNDLKSIELLELVRIQNIMMWERFDLRRRQMEKLLKKVKGASYTADCIQQLRLFHGTRTYSPSLVYDGYDGFDMRVSNAGFYGTGIYFSTSAGYSHDYAHIIGVDAKGRNQYQMFVANVLCGDSLEYHGKIDRTLRRPPTNYSTGLRYDSITGEPGVDRMYVVYDNSQVYPLYLATYITDL